MNTVVPHQAAVPVNHSGSSNAATSGSVPAQQPARSYASATKTASAHSASTPSSHHAPDTSSINGSMAAQGSVQQQTATNGNIPNGTSDHARKPSVVISASGASGHIPNGGPVGQSARPPISFGMINSNQAQDQSSSLPAPSDNPRVISPAHSPSPIPHPATSGGRPPSSLQNQGNGPAFGSIAADAQTPQYNPAQMHERRPSSQSMQSVDSNMGRNYPPQAGRGRGYPQQYGQMGSPAQAFRQLSNSGRPGMNNQFSSGNLPQNAQFRPPNRQQSPAVGHVQPQAPYAYGGYPPQGMYAPDYNAYGGYYPPYGYAPQFGGPGQSGSPRPQYPNPYATPGSGQPPFMPPSMARTPSQASDRPGSSIGHPGTPSQAHVAPSQPGSAQTPSSGANFVRPKKSSAIKITNDKGETINFGKPAAASTTAPSSTPTIAHTPNAPTPPPRTPSAQHIRNESKSAMSGEETREAFKRQVEEKRRQEESAKATPDTKPAESANTDEVVKEAAVDAEKAAAVAAGDKEGEKAAAVAVGDKEGEKAAEVEVKQSGETDEERKKREEQEEEERLIAEMEAAEKEEEEREKAFQAKRKVEKEAAAKKEAEKAANADEELKRQEREAEARELERERERAGEKKSEDDDSKASFASLKRPALGPGATAEEETQDSPTEEAPAETAAQTTASRSSAAQKPKPAHLKLETNRKVEPAEPTPGMQALKSARFLEIKEEALYPQGIKSPNPALNANGTKRGRAYDKDFLLQFQDVFREKPSVDWDQKVRDTLGPGDEPGSARPQSARTPSGAAGRSASSRGGAAASSFGGPMGTFGNGAQGRTLPVGTTSDQRFMASTRGMGMPGQMSRAPSQLGMGGGNMGLNRTNSLQAMGPGSQRQPSSRGGKGASKRGQSSRKEEAEMAARMPLTAAGDVKALEKSTTGWKASSITAGPAANAPSLDGHMAPDMVQRKVKAALNKMTPEKFDKISDQILEIASQSKNETDGRTLRQVIQLTFEKACDEAHWAQMYAQFCHKMLTAMSPEIRDETIKDKSGQAVVGGALFRKYLLNRCQDEFELGWQVNLPDKPEGETEEAALLSDEYYIAAAAKRKGLGLIAFIGQLYKLNMLTSRIMHECVLRLLNFEGAPDESAIETLTTLLKSVGSTMDADQQGRSLVDTYFERIQDKILSDEALPSRPRFMIMDLMDLRRTGWRSKDILKGPKTISEIHAEAEAAQAKAEMERQRTRAGPGGRGGGGRQDNRNFSGQMAPPVNYHGTNVSTDDLRRLQNRGGSNRSMGGGLGPGGSLGPSGLGVRAGSRRGLGPSGSGNSTRTSTPPVGDKDKKEEPAQQNSFSALENLDTEEVESPEASRDRSKSPLPEAKADEA